jgi:MHS family alpha-ketoglutarate permease-like MFS transporter
MSEGAAAATPDQGFTPWRRLKNILGGSAGNFVEWFDWWAYVSFAIYFSSAVFPGDDQTTQLLKAYLPLAAGFLARPIGAYFLGRYADRVGRKAALSLSISIMCLGSLLLAIIPTGTGAVVLAPWLMTAARILQGLSLGGEYGASATYISEMASRKHRGFWSGFLYVTIGGGQLAALLLLLVLQHALSDQQLYAWGWRIPFLIGALFGAVVYWMRRRMHETPSFAAAQGSAERGKTLLLFTRYPRQSLLIFVLTGAGASGFYFYSSYMKDFLVNSAAGPAGHGFSKDVAAQIMTALLICFIVIQPLVGALSDRVGRRTMLMAGFGLAAIAAWPVLTAIMAATSALEVFFLTLLPLLAISTYTALSAIVKAELFPAPVRALGVALPYAIAQAIFSGNVGTAALGLKKAGHETAIFWVLAGLAAAGFIAAWFIGETSRESLIVED